MPKSLAGLGDCRVELRIPRTGTLACEPTRAAALSLDADKQSRLHFGCSCDTSDPACGRASSIGMRVPSACSTSSNSPCFFTAKHCMASITSRKMVEAAVAADHFCVAPPSVIRSVRKNQEMYGFYGSSNHPVLQPWTSFHVSSANERSVSVYHAGQNSYKNNSKNGELCNVTAKKT